MTKYVEDQKVTVWVTKYALSIGLFQATGRISLNGDKKPYFTITGRLFTKDWCETRAEAEAEADKMRKRRIDSLKKQLGKLEKMKFDKTAHVPRMYADREDDE